MKEYLLASIFSVALVTLSGVAHSDTVDRKRGWYWYEDPPEEVEETEELPESTEGTKAVSEGELALQKLKQQGENWEIAAAQALINPTPETVAEYMRQTSQISTQANSFAQVGQQLIWTDPNFNYAAKGGRPTSTQELVGYSEKKTQEQNRALGEIAQKKGLIYYFTSTCPYCKRFSPIIKKFAEQNGITIIPVSLDGVGVPEFPYPKKNYALGSKLEVEGVPAVFMVDPEKNAVAKVSYGFTSYSGLIDRLMAAYTRMESDT